MKERVIIGGLFIFIIGIVGLLGIYLFDKGFVRFNYPSFSDFPVQGIDVSHHQHEIDWSRLNKKKVQFVFMKATEGGDFKDRQFSRNLENARKQGIVVGAYHFFTFCRNGEEQARNYIETVPNDSSMLPPAIDLEYGGNCKLTKSKEELLSDITAFISILEEEYNKRVVIYVTREFYNDYIIDRFPDNPIWFRNVYYEPTLKRRQWVFWQFAHKGRLDGIDTHVDLNVFQGTKEDFDMFRRRTIE